MDELLTADEHAIITALGGVWIEMSTKVVGNGATRRDDLLEVGLHVHALQNFVLSQAAARGYPDLYRLAGRSHREDH